MSIEYKSIIVYKCNNCGFELTIDKTDFEDEGEFSANGAHRMAIERGWELDTHNSDCWCLGCRHLYKKGV